jgi:hypothetical protein
MVQHPILSPQVRTGGSSERNQPFSVASAHASN